MILAPPTFRPARRRQPTQFAPAVGGVAIPSEAPKASQASECSELLDPMRANFWILAQHEPVNFTGLHHGLGGTNPLNIRIGHHQGPNSKIS